MNKVTELRDLLARLELSPKEIDIYTFLYKNGSQACATIAKRINVNRTSIYHSLEKLEEKGLVFSYKKHKITYYSLCDLEKAIMQINMKHDTVKSQKDALLKISELAIDQFGEAGENISDIQHIEFSSNAEKILYRKDIMSNHESICHYYAPTEKKTLTPASYSYAPQTAQNPKLRILCPQDTAHIVHSRFHTDVSHSVKSSVAFPFPENTDVMIAGEQIIVFESDSAFVLQSAQLAQMFQSVFDQFWYSA